MNREPVEIHPRKSFTKKQRLEIFTRAEGRCQCGCGKKLQPGFHIEHRNPLWRGGTNDIENLEAWIPACHASKTAGEASDRGKVNRLIKKADPLTRKPSRMQSRNEWPKGQKLQSRGFPKKPKGRPE
jgi:hypothetical protein